MDSFDIKSNSIFDRRHLNLIKKWWLDIDKVNFVIVLGIIVFGLMMTASSGSAIAKRINVDKFFFLKKQMLFAMIAMFLLVAISFLDQEKIKIFALFGLGASIILLVLVLLFGAEAKGAKRWIALFGFTLQPSEFAKTFFVIFNAFLLHRFYLEKWHIKYGISFGLFMVIVALLILQPDFGMTIIFAALWSVQIFLSGIPLPFILIMGAGAIVFALGAYAVFPHVQDRIGKFMDSGEKNYQVERSLDAFVNGSLFGEGPGNGVVKNFIPDAHTDFVFAVVGEEYGIFSCIMIIIIFAYLITRIVRRALDEEDMFTYLSLCGLMMQFTMQVIVNVGVSLRLFPTKGMTLPFISYGGSSMMSMAICFGLILAFTKRKYHKDVDYGNLKFI
jgi:cell division protein FtsW